MKPRAIHRELGTDGRRIAAEGITAQDVQSLERTASARRFGHRFSPHIEREFQRFVRYSSRNLRFGLLLATSLMFLSVPIWGELLLGEAASETLGPIALPVGLIVALFVTTAVLQFRFWHAELVEWLLLAAFVSEIVFIEYLRHESERAGLWIDPSTSMVVPVAVVLLGRFPLDRAFLFVATYGLMLYATSQMWPIGIAVRGESTWLIQGLCLGSVLLSASWSKTTSRRQWAATWLLQMMAFRDSLTGLPNRRAMENHHDMSVRAISRYGDKRVLLALVDLDHFKKINDHYGHDYGDGVLAEFSMTLSRHARRALDIAARVGGEEFCLIISDLDPRNAEAFLASIVSETKSLEIENIKAPLGVLTCSVGAVIAKTSTPLSTLYKLADECLYQAKADGRNTFRFRQVDDPGSQDPTSTEFK
ncbi:MAG: GGDEF domain-containing protein [Pseudomonadota bacterium]|nr:GGDEF domain-containing protein [Pseudomonadota bacterium]